MAELNIIEAMFPSRRRRDEASRREPSEIELENLRRRMAAVEQERAPYQRQAAPGPSQARQRPPADFTMGPGGYASRAGQDLDATLQDTPAQRATPRLANFDRYRLERMQAGEAGRRNDRFFDREGDVMMLRDAIRNQARSGVIADIPLDGRLPSGQTADGRLTFDDATGLRSNAEILTDVEASLGAPPGYLETLIARESGGDRRAQPIDLRTKQPLSSALGLTQFTEATWRDVMDRHGERFGVPQNLSDAELLGLREDPRYAMAGALVLAEENAADIRSRIGRDPTLGEVYLAHFAGSEVAADFIRAAARGDGGRAAARYVPQRVVKANPGVFYQGNRQRSVNEVIARLAGDFPRGRWRRRTSPEE